MSAAMPPTDTTSGFKANGPRAIALFAQHYPAEYLGDTIDSLVDLISIQRNYQAVQRAVTTIDDIRGRISELGRPV